MKEETNCRLLIGLGNPGMEYENTRHNMGSMIVRAFAQKFGLSFQASSFLQGEIASGKIENHKTLLLIPKVYMNHSGVSVKLCMEYYRVSVQNTLVICDDIALPLQDFRYRKKGSAGGHNGLKNIQSQLGTGEYPRLRVGIGDKAAGDLSDYVLGHFTKEEKEKLPFLLDAVIEFIVRWVKGEISYGFTYKAIEKNRNVGE